MNSCQSSGNTGCSSTDQSDSSGDSRLGTWIGTAIGVWIALLIIVWFLRTFINKTRRKRFLRKVCIRKQTTGRQHPPAQSSKSTRRSANEVIYYTPTLPPSYSETMRRPAQFYLPSSPDSETMRRPAQFYLPSSPVSESMRRPAQFYLPSSPDRILEGQPQFYLPSSPGGFPCFPGHIQFCIPCSAFLPSRLKKYRGSLSTLSISLPPIEEDVEVSEPTTPTSNTPDKSDSLTLNLRPCQYCSHCPSSTEHSQNDKKQDVDSDHQATCLIPIATN